MADPPWSYENYSKAGEAKNAKAHYDCMSLEEIKRMPVSQIATPDSLLFLWVTNPMLDQGMEVLKAWDFNFCTAGHWSKRNPETGKLAFGTGYVLRSAGEPFLIGTIGKPKTAKNIRSVIEGPRREHSRKPEEAYVAAENLIPDAKRIELFSRTPRAGWDTWGDEAEKFQAA
ncbi:MAG: MT-A70 family methyltransferase [Rhizobiaceae bacterium]